LYFVENDHGRLGPEFQALDRDTNSRAEVIREIRSGGIHPVKIIEVIEPCEDFPRGAVTDVTAELKAEAEQPREAASLEDIRQRLADLQRDKRRDLIKEGVYGW
jgi:hypothetical protein